MGFDVSKVRDWANENSAAVTIGAIVVMIASLAYMWFGSGGGPSGGSPSIVDVYFYDITKKEFFTGPGDQIPPIDTESGPKMGVRAYIFGCGGCKGGSDLEGTKPEELKAKELFVGYYEGYTPEYKDKLLEAKAKADAGDPSAIYYMEEGFGEGLLRSIDGEEWVAANSEEGTKLNRALGKMCPQGSRLKPCYPGRE